MKSRRFFLYFFHALAATFVAAGAFAQTANRNFTIKGTIPGIKNGTKVSLRSQESGKRIEAECLSKGASFTLAGKVNGTLLVQLQIDDKPQNAYKQDEYAEDRGGKFMLEAGNYIVTAACFDSIARNYDLEEVAMVHEKNLRIVGGKAQQQYQEWADATFCVRLKAEQLEKELRTAMFRDRKHGGADTAVVNRLQPLVDEAAMTKDKENERFIAEHPDYAISLLLKADEIEKPFACTAADYDKILTTFADNYDKARYEELVKNVNIMKTYVKGTHYKNLALENPEGKAVSLKDVVMPGKYNFIDFWASWCGPCRAAIPSVKKLYQKMDDKLNIISISVDKRKNDWEKALETEKMPWSQFLVPATSMSALTDAYYVKYIPSLVVIDPDGNIQLFTGDPKKAHSYLDAHVR